MEERHIREAVKKSYAKTVKQDGSCGCSQKANYTDTEFIRQQVKLSGILTGS